MLIRVSLDELLANGRNIAVDMTEKLDDGELCTGNPIITITLGLTASAISVNSSTIKVLGQSLVAGEAIQLHVAATSEATTAGLYDIHGICSTDSTPAQSVDFDMRLDVR